MATAAAQGTTAPPPPATGFALLEPYVGHCWIGTFPDGKQTDEHCFDWMFDHKFVRDRHVVRNGAAPYEGETIYSWDAKRRRVAYSYYNSEGQVISGVVESVHGALVFPGQYFSPQGMVQTRAVWSAPQDDHYTIAQSQKSGAKWKPILTMTMKRQ